MQRIPLRLATRIAGVSLALLALATIRAQADPLPPPHLGYGVNVRLNVDRAQGLGFEWLKLYEADYLFPSPNDFPAEAATYHILYRVKAEGWPASIENYVEHIRQVVQAGKTKNVKAYEIGNEPNIKPMWGEQTVSPENYARLLCRVYPEIKAIDPAAIVVSAGIAPVGRQPVKNWAVVMDDHVYVQRMFDAMRTEFPKRWPCFDAFGFHPQGYPYPPEISYAELQQQHPGDNENGFHFRASEYYHALMEGYGIGDRQIWATEFGYLRDPITNPWDFTSPPWPNYGWCNDSRYAPGFADSFSWMKITEQQQADYLVRAYQYADAYMPWMGVLFLYNIDWNNQGWECDHVKFFSIYKAVTGKADADPLSRVKSQAFAALAHMPKRSAYTNTPALAVEPASLTFLAERTSPGVQTGAIQIDNLNPLTPMTWTAQIDPAAALQPGVTPLNGVNAATLTVQVDSATFATSGTYTGAINISANPTTSGSPAAIGVKLIVADELNRVYLPVVSRNYTAPTPIPPPGAVTTKFGLDFISSAESPAANIRYQHASTLKATINRWPFYWYNIERDPIGQPGQFTWSTHDANVIADINRGLTVNAILMGTPVQFSGASAADAVYPQVGQGWKIEAGEISPQASDGVDGTPADPPPGLYLSVFNDGTDTPGSGKTINPSNRWARFVNAVVNRYKPGGALAQQQGWGNTQGVTLWEVWNEPDLNFFFNGAPADYARLLKVAYLAGKHADPNAQIMFGGMAHFEKPNWLRDVLNVVATYPDRQANGWFFDIVASHNYHWAWRTFSFLFGDQQTLASFGITGKKLWLNETGVHVCNDAPGPNCFDNEGRPSAYRASMGEQAAFLIQTMTFAVWMNTDAVVWYQLYDDSGNGCGGYDAPGLVRNEANAPCYPQTGSPRPAYDAYKMVTQYFAGLSPYWRRRPTENQELVALQNPKTGERVIAMWARDYVNETVTLTATASSALLVYPNGATQTITPVNGSYTIALPAATNRNAGTADGKALDGKSPIGGMPRILIEHDPAIAVTP
ncbi:MAG TPA: hypothetical protein VJG32_19330 [Anaerolineae bacterium]|nr:hypothetical protein [Anaerolineae bacterium]